MNRADPVNESDLQKMIRGKIPESNLIVSRALIALSAVCLVVWGMFQFHFLSSEGPLVDYVLLACPVLFIIIALLCIRKKGQGKIFPYLCLGLLSVFWLMLEMMTGYKCRLLLVAIIILTLRYYNRRFTLIAYFVTLFDLFLSICCNAFLYHWTGILDLNLVRLSTNYRVVLQGFLYNNIIILNPDPVPLFLNGMRLCFLPNGIILTFIAVLTIRFMNFNFANIVKVEELASLEANRQAQLADMKTKMMLSQIQPHFLYNTLTTIACLCGEDPMKAEELTNRFSTYLQNNFTSLAENRDTLFSRELEAIRNYLEIEKVRFGDRIRVEYDIRCEDFSLPVLSIQPLVENSVKHGLCKKKEGGTIRITALEEQNQYVITVRDDGIGFDPDAVGDDGRVHVGLSNVTNRIVANGGQITVASKPGAGTAITVNFPKEVY